jgi:hypothetical protein
LQLRGRTAEASAVEQEVQKMLGFGGLGAMFGRAN